MIKLITLLFIFLSVNLRAQQGIVASGGDTTGSGGSISFSIGQIDYLAIVGPGGFINEGLQQPFVDIIVGVIDTSRRPPVIYPNPTTNYVVIKIECGNEENITYQIYDVLGNLLVNEKIKCHSMETIVSVEDLPNAVYFMKVFTDTDVKLFKIIKNP
jgi:hypothetical protein